MLFSRLVGGITTIRLACTHAPPRPQVPFEQVPDLVAGRRVFLRAGAAFVARDQIASLVGPRF